MAWRRVFKRKRLLVYAEQGLGDLIQFSRYLPLLVKQGTQVLLEAPASLTRLMESLDDGITVIAAGAER